MTEKWIKEKHRYNIPVNVDEIRKGKWWACCLKSKPHFVFQQESEESICTINWRNYFNEDLPTEEIQANALLISKSPEMLEALQYFVDRVENGTIRSTTTYNKYKQLIKEATEL